MTELKREPILIPIDHGYGNVKTPNFIFPTGIMEYIELSQEFGIVEMEPIPAWVGKTIRELELRNTYGVNVIAVRSQEDTIKIPPDIDTPIPADVVMVMLGKYEMFENLKRK